MTPLEKDHEQLKLRYAQLQQKYQALLEKHAASLEEKVSFKQTAGLPMVAHCP